MWFIQSHFCNCYKSFLIQYSIRTIEKLSFCLYNYRQLSFVSIKWKSAEYISGLFCYLILRCVYLRAKTFWDDRKPQAHCTVLYIYLCAHSTRKNRAKTRCDGEIISCNKSLNSLDETAQGRVRMELNGMNDLWLSRVATRAILAESFALAAAGVYTINPTTSKVDKFWETRVVSYTPPPPLRAPFVLLFLFQ